MQIAYIVVFLCFSKSKKYIIFKHDKSVIYLTLSSFQSRITFLHGTEKCLAE